MNTEMKMFNFKRLFTYIKEEGDYAPESIVVFRRTALRAEIVAVPKEMRFNGHTAYQTAVQKTIVTYLCRLYIDFWFVTVRVQWESK